MGALGTTEFLIIAAILLVLFGGSQIPKLARSLGRAQREFNDGLSCADEGEDESSGT